MRQNGFSPLLIILIAAALLTVGGSIYIARKTPEIKPPSPPAQTPPPPTALPAPLPTPPPTPPPAPPPEPPPEKPSACIQLYDPVCGIDGKTYSNDCFAGIAGVEIKHKGKCVIPPKPVPPPEPLPPPPAPPPVPPPAPAPSPAPVAEPQTEFQLEADDNGFYPSGPISVAKGAKVTLTFLVRSTNVYFGGLDFRSPKFNTETLKPGASTTVEFIADESFTIISYWPVSNVEKARIDLKIQ